MRKLLIAFFGVLLLACSGDDVLFDEMPELQGTWLLIEQYADPGDGSGDFKKVDSNKTIRFLENGTYIAKGSLCDMNFNSGEDTTGTYEIGAELSEYSADNYMKPEDCGFDGVRIYIQMEGSNLILSYLCIEGCAQKFKKTSS